MISLTAELLFKKRENFNQTTIYLDRSESKDIVFYYLWSDKNIVNLKKRINSLDLNLASNSCSVQDLSRKVEPRTIIVNKKIEIETHHKIIYLDETNWKKARQLYAEYFFPIRENLKQIAITGTNGKTTSCFLGMLLANHIKKQALYIGTLGIYLNGKKVEDHYLTTPNLIDYRRIVNQYQDQVDMVWVEASSHGIHQNRLEGIMFDAIGWTSFSLDHLDYHSDIQEYFKAKKNIFKQLKKSCKDSIRLGEPIDKLENYKVAMKVHSGTSSFLKLKHNHKNLSLVTELLKLTNFEVHNHQLDSFNPSVPGRFCVLNNAFVIDYAHTPDALDRLLNECQQIWEHKKIITVIGCGGDRDRSKRAEMAKIACHKSYYSIFTEDNPRTENLEQIFSDMKLGINSLDSSKYNFVGNRKKAIDKAYAQFQKSPEEVLIIIAGKGEENYIIRENSKEQHNDLDYIRGIHDLS